MSERIAGVDGGAMYAGGVRSHRGGKRRSSLDAGMASRTLTIMTRWHESIRSCAGGAAPTHCSMGIFQVWRGGGSTASDCCASSGLVRATYTHYQTLPCLRYVSPGSRARWSTVAQRERPLGRTSPSHKNAP